MKVDRQVEILYLIVAGLKDKTRDNQLGMCTELSRLCHSGIITREERVVIYNLMEKNKPSRELFPKLFNSPHFRQYGGFWWQPLTRDKNMLRPRVTYLHRLISKIISDEENN